MKEEDEDGEKSWTIHSINTTGFLYHKLLYLYYFYSFFSHRIARLIIQIIHTFSIRIRMKIFRHSNDSLCERRMRDFNFRSKTFGFTFHFNGGKIYSPHDLSVETTTTMRKSRISCLLG